MLMKRHNDMVTAALAAAGIDGPLDVASLSPDSPLRPLYVPSSFFYTKLIEDARDSELNVLEKGYCYTNVRGWTKRAKVAVFGCKAVIVPMNFSNTHWALAVVRPQAKRIEVFDSLGGGSRNHAIARTLLRWLGDEFEHKMPAVSGPAESPLRHWQLTTACSQYQSAPASYRSFFSAQPLPLPHPACRV